MTSTAASTWRGDAAQSPSRTQAAARRCRQPETSSKAPTPPSLTGAKLSAKRIRAARKGATIARKAGAKLSFTLSEAAVVRVAVRKGAKTVGAPVMIAGQAGKTTKRFTGRAGSKKLKPGRYTLQLGATDAGGNAAKTVKLRFRIVR